jgi:hypothetical protein
VRERGPVCVCVLIFVWLGVPGGVRRHATKDPFFLAVPPHKSVICYLKSKKRKGQYLNILYKIYYFNILIIY